MQLSFDLHLLQNGTVEKFKVVLAAFSKTNLSTNMLGVKENSEWHHEESVWHHTIMVVNEFIRLSLRKEYSDDEMIVGLVTCLFHDTGKPTARGLEKNKITKEDGSIFYRFTGHELISARIFEDFYMTHYDELYDVIPEYIAFKIQWAIEHHLPYGLKKSAKVKDLAKTIKFLYPEGVYYDILLADTIGRISTNQYQKIDNTMTWIDDMKQIDVDQSNFYQSGEDKKILHIMIGASGSGKSTISANLMKNENISYYSLDDLRIHFYLLHNDNNDLSEKELYSKAFEYCTENDADFRKYTHKKYMDMVKSDNDIIVDNTNVSKKSRAFYITEAKKHGYFVIAYTFPIDLYTLLYRHTLRTDKFVPEFVIKNQYNRIQLPSIKSEVDSVITICQFK